MEESIENTPEGKGQTMQSKTTLLSSKQAAEYLDVSMAQLYRLTSQRSIPFYQPTGGKLYFNRTELDEWVWSHRVKTTIDLSAEANNYLLTKKNVA